MKKLLVTLICALMLLSMFGCSSNSNEPDKDLGDTLVVYVVETDTLIDSVIPYFEEAYNCKVEYITGGGGEMLSRIEAEAENPQADVMMGGQAYPYAQYFEPVSDELKAAIGDAFPIDEESVISYKLNASCMIINVEVLNKVAPGLELKTRMDILSCEALKGQISTADFTTSGSAFGHVRDLLYAADGEEHRNEMTDESWEKVKQLLVLVDGKYQSGSSAVPLAVSNGEYPIGLSYEEAVIPYVMGDSNLKIWYPEDGNCFEGSSLAIVKGAKHAALAEEFVKFCCSVETQKRIAENCKCRTILGNNTEVLTPLENIVQISKDDMMFYSNKRSEIVQKLQSVVASLN